MPTDAIKVLIAGADGVVLSEFLLGEGVHAIGSATGSAILIGGAEAEHARLHLQNGELFIEDLGTTAGIFLDGMGVRGRLGVSPGQTLQVGDRWLALQAPTSVQAKVDEVLARRYRLIRPIGRGGRGEVWLARDEELSEEIALKRLPPEMANDAVAISDLRREVQKSRHLSHNNIIRIHDLVQPPGEPAFVTLEFINGQDLATMRLSQPGNCFKWETLRPLMSQLCDALEYAHQNKIVHRDLKPANMMVDAEGNLKLADFGIAASMADSLSRSSMQGSVSGTTLYMSPQQMRGEIPRASDDLYALGSTFYELLTSRPPFSSGDVTYQVLNVEAKPLAERLSELGLQNQVPDAVCAMIMACLAKDPAHRPASAAAVEEWISSSDDSSLPPITPSTLGHAPSDEPPPLVPTRNDSTPPVFEIPQPTVHEKIAAAGWGSIEARDNPWYQGFIAVVAFFALLLVIGLRDLPKDKILGSVIFILIFWFGLSAIGKHLLKPKRFTCSQCGGKLLSDQPGPCPHCDASLT
ncbi:MAG: protein kinase [Verrucomicrobia subdivision 3 bacterium]|nr:protein kinase [Limisphaerales bacterium]